MNKQKLRAWLDTQISLADDDKGGCSRLTLRHVGSGNSSKDGDIWTKKLECIEGVCQVSEDEITELADAIHTAAFDDAEGLGGLQRYRVLAYFENDSIPHRHTFRMEGSHDADDDQLGLSEPASKRGFMGQMMRHNESLMRTAVLSVNQTVGLLQKTVHTQSSQIEELLRERRDNFEMMEDLKSKRHERELRTMEYEQKERVHNAIAEKVGMLVPVVANRIAGKQVLPENTANTLLKQLAESIDPQQLQGMLAALKPEQQIALMEMLEATQPSDADNEDTVKKLNGSN